MDIVKEIKQDGKVIKIFRDVEVDSPQDADAFGKMIYTSTKYLLGGEQLTSEELDSIENNVDNICLPVYAYVHGSVQLNTTGFNCKWDSGQCGLVYTTIEDALYEFSELEMTPQLLEKIKQRLVGDVETFNQYLNGEVYGYTVTGADGEIIDECYQYYGLEHCIEAAQENL